MKITCGGAQIRPQPTLVIAVIMKDYHKAKCSDPIDLLPVNFECAQTIGLRAWCVQRYLIDFAGQTSNDCSVGFLN